MTLPMARRGWALFAGGLALFVAGAFYAPAPVALPDDSARQALDEPARLTHQAADPAGQPAGRLLRHRAHLCFAPGTPRETIETVYAAIQASSGGADAYEFKDRNRWSATAHQPLEQLGQGDPTVLSWSIVPDGTMIVALLPDFGEKNEPSDLIAYLDDIYGGEDEDDVEDKPWFHLFEEAFESWGEKTGITYVYEENDDGRSIREGSRRGRVGVRGDIRIGGHAIDGDGDTLAYNYEPDNGDMVIDTSDDYYEDTDNDSRRLRSTVAHEHGHGLGIAHVCPGDGTKLMEVFDSDELDGPQFDDILAAQRGYGDWAEPNDDSSEATDLGDVDVGDYAMNFVSIDDETDTDWYRISVQDDLQATITLSPTGTTYLSGPQKRDGSCSDGDEFDASSQQDLGLEIIEDDGVTVLAEADDEEAGGVEVIKGLRLEPGDYFMRVLGTSRDTIQMYTLKATFNDGQPGGPVLLEASSRMRHGRDKNAVEFDLPLALQGDATVEPRVIGVHRLILRFSSAVSLTCADVSLSSALCGFANDLGNGETWEIELGNVEENNCQTLSFLPSLGLDPSSPSSVRMLNILGDVDQDGSVGITDLLRVKAGIRRASEGPLDETNFLLDVQLSNSVTIGDLSEVKSNFGHSATCEP